jgi:hypothetical protein
VKEMQDKVVVIHQPDFMPYLGFFDRLLKADIYVVLDTVQFVKRWTGRDKIKTENGEQWITVETKKAPVETKINQIYLVEDTKWKKKHLNIICYNYKKAPFYSEIIPYVEKIYQDSSEKLSDFNLRSIRTLMELFDIHIECIMASDINPVGKNNTLNIDIMKKLDCRRYLSGVGAKDYYVAELYEEAGIEVIWQDFEHPIYRQQYGEFIPYLSSIDLLFNCGIEESRKILRRIQ